MEKNCECNGKRGTYESVIKNESVGKKRKLWKCSKGKKIMRVMKKETFMKV